MKVLFGTSFLLMAVISSQPVLARVAVKQQSCAKGQHWTRCENPQSGRKFVGCCPVHPQK
jgi:hypothetical protein